MKVVNPKFPIRPFHANLGQFCFVFVEVISTESRKKQSFRETLFVFWNGPKWEFTSGNVPQSHVGFEKT